MANSCPNQSLKLQSGGHGRKTGRSARPLPPYILDRHGDPSGTDRARPSDDYLIRPDPADPRLTERVTGVDQTGAPVETSVTVERPLTIFLNAPGDRHRDDDRRLSRTTWRSATCSTRTCCGPTTSSPASTTTTTSRSWSCAPSARPTTRRSCKKTVQTSGCAQGTVFGDLMELIEGATLAGRDAAHLVALCADPQDQHHALALSRGRRDPRLRARAGGPAAGLHGGRRAPQRGRQDRRLDVPEPGRAPTTRSSTPPAGSPPRW